MKNAKIQTPEIVAYEVRYKTRDNKIEKVQFPTEEEALEHREQIKRSQDPRFPPVWSEVYRLRTKKT